jgi:predicted PurR-regulated permease PerM
MVACIVAGLGRARPRPAVTGQPSGILLDLLIPLVLGLLISQALQPIVGRLDRAGLPRLAGASLVMLILTAGLGWGAYGLRNQVDEVLDAMPRAARALRRSPAISAAL